MIDFVYLLKVLYSDEIVLEISMSLLRVTQRHLCRASSVPQHIIFKTVTTKKNVSDPFPAKYSPDLEAGWYDWWEAQGYFKPDSVAKYFPGGCGSNPQQRAKFSMVLPPPNVTGVLHIGHALTATIEVSSAMVFSDSDNG